MRRFSARQGAIAVVAVAAIGVAFAWDGFVGALALAVAITALLTDWKPFARRPTLVATLVRDGERINRVVVGPERLIRPIDSGAIVEEQMEAARQTWEPPIYSYSAIGAGALEPHEAAVDRFEREQSDYGKDLSEWLGRYEALRWPECAFVEAYVCLHNTGTAPAENVRLRLRVPNTLRVVDEGPKLGPPPTSPVFKQRSRFNLNLADFGIGTPTLPLRLPSDKSRGGLKGPTIFEDGGTTIVDFGIANLPHGIPEISASSLRCVPSVPGEHVIQWEAHAGNLAEPVSGAFMIVVREQGWKDEPMTKLTQLLAEDVSLIQDDAEPDE